MRANTALGRLAVRILLLAFWTQSTAAYVPPRVPPSGTAAGSGLPHLAQAPQEPTRAPTTGTVGAAAGDRSPVGRPSEPTPVPGGRDRDRDRGDRDQNGGRHKDDDDDDGDDDDDDGEDCDDDDEDDHHHDRSSQAPSCEEALEEGLLPRVSVAKRELWPPDHKLVDVGLQVDLADACRSRASVQLAVFSDEPDNGTGDGDTAIDAKIAPPDLFLRRERSGSGDGRVYLIAATASHEGVSSTRCATVVVPKSGSKRDLERVRRQACAARAYCGLAGGPPGFHLVAEGLWVGGNHAPRVDAGPDLGIDFGTVASLQGTAVDDGLPAGVLEVSWSLVEGPGSVAFDPPNAASTTASFAAPGTYRLRLTADDTALQASDEVMVVVSQANTAPVVDAGPDQVLTLPNHTTTLVGQATDDGRPGGALSTLWSQVSGPGPVVLSAPDQLTTLADFPTTGEYVLRLTADDGELTGSDELTVRVDPEPGPVLEAADASVTEGQEGATGALVSLSLSKPWPRPVTVDYMTADGTAAVGCDYSLRYGTLTLAPGETASTLLVPVVGDLAVEGDETVRVLLGNATEASLARDEAVLTVRDDDVPNEPPLRPANPSPGDGATDVAPSPVLSWSGGDPEGGPVGYDVYLGTSFGTTGQQWLKHCAEGPGPRRGAVTAYDEARDRLLVFGGSGTDPDRLWILENANGAGGAPAWVAVSTTGGPSGLMHAAAAYDLGSNRLVVFGGCTGSCDAGLGETWILENANGLGGAPAWLPVPISGPSGRFAAASAYDPASDRLLLFGGAESGGGPDLSDLWVLHHASGVTGIPLWEELQPQGVPPAPRHAGGAAFDAAASRLWLFGGRDSSDQAFGDVFVLEAASGAAGPPTWSAVSPLGEGPAPRFGHAVALDPVAGRLLVFGGTTAGVAVNENYVFSDTWLLAGLEAGGTPEWIQVAAAGPRPSGRFFVVSGYSRAENRLILGPGDNNKSGPAGDLFLLADAGGRLPQVAADQPETTFAPGALSRGTTYYWRVRAHDDRGATASSPLWRFRPALPSLSVSGGSVTEGDAGTSPLVFTITLSEPSDEEVTVAYATADGTATSSDYTPTSGTLTFVPGGPLALEVAVAVQGDLVREGDETLALLLSAPTRAVLGQATATGTIVDDDPENRAPAVDAGPDRSVAAPSTVLLSGSVSDDGRPAGVLTSTWTVESGPAPVAFGDPSLPVTTAELPASGLYVLRLTASDGDLSGSDVISVLVGSPSELPDLRVVGVDVSALDVDPTTLAMSGTVAAEVKNAGTGPAAASFTVTFFEDRDGNGLLDPADNLVATADLFGLDAGASAVVAVPAAAVATFAGNLIHAFVDSGAAVVESDETNNYGSSAAACSGAPAADAWNIAVEWAWGVGPVGAPQRREVLVQPAVADLTGDGVPEIVVIAAAPALASYLLVALRGTDGSELFAIPSPGAQLYYLGQLAVGDLDGDGRPEILAPTISGLIAFEHDGTFRWENASLGNPDWGGPNLADLDGDGRPEIVLGRKVLNADGSVRWKGTGGEGRNHAASGENSIAVDLDLDGRPEVVGGNTAYRGSGPGQGQVLWRNTETIGDVTVGDGFTGAGNFDADPNPEIVLVSRGHVFMLEHDGRLKWGPVEIPGGGYRGYPVCFYGGKPTIADLDGDGDFEIALLGCARFVALEGDGTIKWEAPVEDSTASGGNVAFDFDGDGAAEVAYADENGLRIHRGSDGVVLVDLSLGNGTAGESPVVADVDADGEAELVAVSDGLLGGAGRPGVWVLGEENGRWPGARRVFNQVDYHLTNINDDLTVPAQEARDLKQGHRWAQAGAVKDGVLTPPLCAFPKADLVPSALRIGAGPMLTVRVGNGGSRLAGPGVAVSFYDGDLRLGRRVLGTAETTAALLPGQFEDVTLALAPGTTTRASVFVVADDIGNGVGRVVESDEENNVYDSGRALLTAPGSADLAVPAVDGSGVLTDPRTLETTGTVTAEVRNQGDAPAAGPFVVAFFEDRDGDGALTPGDNVIASAELPGLPPGAAATASAPVTGSLFFRGSPILAFADSTGVVPESDEANNVSRSGAACGLVPEPGAMELRTEWTWTPSEAPTSTNVGSAPVVADLDRDGVPEIVFQTFAGAITMTNGRLRAVHGNDGSASFTVTDPALDVNALFNLAVGDLDGDGRLEIVAGAESERRLRAFNHDGTPRWTSDVLELILGRGSPFLADLDGDGKAEIVFGRQVLNSDGTLRWTGSQASRGHNGAGIGPQSIVTDLDLDGVPEVVVGNTAYRNDGSVYWTKPTLLDGLTAVANFDDDPNPEIVLVSSNAVRLLDHDGALRWGPVTVPGTAGLSGVTIADFDGDGRPEIGAGVRGSYSLIDSGFIRWTVPVAHGATLTATPLASAFDFDGDGAAEIVLADEERLRVLRGRDGALLAETPLETCTTGRFVPVVADVDGDHRAEIVMGSATECDRSLMSGLRVVGERHGRFTSARPLWNQHAYCVGNVEDDGRWPWPAKPVGFDGVLRNSFGSGPPRSGADLTASYVRRSEQGTDLRFTVRVGNAGAAPASAGVPVSFYNGDPRLGFEWLGAATTSTLIRPGEFEDVDFLIPSSQAAQTTVQVVADDPGDRSSLIAECDEENNLVDSGFRLNLAPEVDAGPDQTITLPQTVVSLSGSATDDGLPIGSSLSTLWFYWGGPQPSHDVFSDNKALATTANLTVPGVHRLALQVVDGAFLVGLSLVDVTVLPQNQPPTVSAGEDRFLALPTRTLTLAGAATDDGQPPGSTLSVAWQMVSGPGAAVFADSRAATSEVTLPVAGTYVLRLTATDGSLSASDEVTVVLDPENQPPAVEAGPDQRMTTFATTLEGVVTDDGLPRGSTLSVAWSVRSGPGTVVSADPASPTTTASFAAVGVYVLRLSGSDGSAESFDEISVNVNPENEPPVVSAGPDLMLVTATTTLQGSVTDDGLPPGGPVSVTWSLVSGPAPVTFATPGSPVTLATFPADGVYVVRLSATDGVLSAFDEAQVQVARQNQAPVVSAGEDQTLTLPVNTALLQGSATDDGLPSGSSLGYRWSLVSGPAAVSFADPLSATTTASFDTIGAYLLRLTVSDGSLSGQDELVVTVQGRPPVGAAPVVQILQPAERDALSGPVAVTGSVGSDDLFLWKLERRESGDPSWTFLASGTTEMTAAELGSFDPTLLRNGLHQIRLSATDNAGRTTATTVRVVVKDNRKVGHFSVSFVDLEVPLSGLPIRLTRSYDSRDKGRGDFGIGWRLDISSLKVEENGVLGHSFAGTKTSGAFPSYCLPPIKPLVVTLTEPSGRVHEFEPVVTPACQPFVPIEEAEISFRARPGTLGTLVPADGSQVFVVSDFLGTAQLFSATSFTIFDPSTYRYTAPDGREFTVKEGEGLKSLKDLSSNRLTVTPGGVTYTNPTAPGSTRGVVFTRDAQGRITKITDPAGNAMSYAYDGNGDLVGFTDREGNTTSFTYEPSFPHHLKEIQDPLGRTPIRNEYYPDGRLKSHTDAFGKTIHYSHDLSASQEVVTDRNGDTRVLDYDERGNVLKETQPDGRIIRRTFDARNNRLSETEPHDLSSPAPATTSYTYDAQDNLLTATDPLGNTTSYTYNARGQVLTTKDAKGKHTTNTYDAKGNLLTTTDPLGNVTSYSYDTRGNVLMQTVSVLGVAQTTSYAYDAFGNLTKETDASGHETSYSYDANGNRLSQTTTRTTPTGVQTLVTIYEYDKLGRLVKTTDPDGSFTRTVYDALGRQVESHDKLGRKTSYSYDEMWRLTKTTYPDLTTEESSYDAEGRRLSSKDRAGRTTGYEYDSLGRPTKTTYPDSTFTENSYDEAGRLVATKDARGKTTSFEYDSAGRRTKVRDPLGNETVFTYDENGNQKTVRDARLNTTTYEYDELNRRTKAVFPDSTFTLTTYDSLGRRTSETNQGGRTTSFSYDALGRLTKVKDALNQETVYAYDELGNRTSQTDANGHTTSFEYDKLGRQTARILPDGKREEMSYDAAGNLLARTDFMGRTTTYAYDDNNRLLSRSYPNPQENVSFTYTATGRRLTATDARGTTSYGYDLRDRLTSLVQPGFGVGTTSLGYTYDGNGNRLTLTATVGSQSRTTSYTYDDAGRLDVVTDPAGRAYDHGYDQNGNRASLAHPNGTSTAYTYDTLNRLTSLTTTAPLGVVQGYAFTLGPAGNRTKIEENGGVVREYSYDALYRLTGEKVTETIGLVYEKSFSYDAVGNRQTQTTALGPAGSPGPNLQPGTISYGYDSRDRLLTETGIAGGYGWDDNGNLTTKDAEATYTWDHENRLVKVTKADGTVVEHLYDVDGNRVRTATTPPGGPTITRDFLVDASGSLSHVVAEVDGSAATPTLQALYIRGDDLLSVMRPLVAVPASAGDWQTRYYHADGIGSIRRLTDEAGNITDGYTYSAFGELLAHTGSDPQPYAFTGEPLDPNVGWQYHRARWMDPRVGRFASSDLFPGVQEVPATLHRYSYAGNDPVAKVDPTGHFETLATLSVGLSMMSTINAISVPNALAATPDFLTVYVRSFAPWAVFGTIYKGDNRGFTTSRSKEVTSRIWAYVRFDVRTARILDRNVGSDPSHQIWPVEREANGTPQMNATTAGRDLRIDVWGNNPLFPGSADVDIHLNANTRSSGNKTCFSGSMTGDGFPNAEVFVVGQGNRATMIHTFATTADPDTGPYRLLPGDFGRDMGTFANRCH